MSDPKRPGPPMPPGARPASGLRDAGARPQVAVPAPSTRPTAAAPPPRAPSIGALRPAPPASRQPGLAARPAPQTTAAPHAASVAAASVAAPVAAAASVAPASRAPASPPAAPGPRAAAPTPGPIPLDPGGIYFVESPQDPTALLARGAAIRDGWLFWDDTNRDRARQVVEAKVEDGAVHVLTERETRYVFRPLTLELYDAHVRPNVELSPSFPSTEALVDFYKNASF
jgi:hypothetical protein